MRKQIGNVFFQTILLLSNPLYEIYISEGVIYLPERKYGKLLVLKTEEAPKRYILICSSAVPDPETNSPHDIDQWCISTLRMGLCKSALTYLPLNKAQFCYSAHMTYSRARMAPSPPRSRIYRHLKSLENLKRHTISFCLAMKATLHGSGTKRVKFSRVFLWARSTIWIVCFVLITYLLYCNSPW